MTGPTCESWRPGSLGRWTTRSTRPPARSSCARCSIIRTRLLYPNQFVNARLLVNTLQDTVRVPVPAVQRGEPGTFVYVINANNTVSVRPVKLGPTDGGYAAVLSGLQPGDRVVTDGTDRLRDGAKVTVPAPGRSARPRSGSHRPSRLAGQTPNPANQHSPANQRSLARRRPSPVSAPTVSAASAIDTAAMIRAIRVVVGARHEPVAPLHPAAGRDHAADGRDHAGRHRRLPLPAGLRAAGGRLPDHPGADLLSGRQPGGDDLGRHLAARGAVRPDAEPEPDVLDQFGRGVGDHPAVQPGSQPRHRGTGGAGGDQRGGQSAAVGPAGAADLRQGQSGRCADPDAGADLEDPAADPGRGSGRHAARAEDLAAARRRPGQHQRRPAAGGARPGQSRARWPPTG